MKILFAATEDAWGGFLKQGEKIAGLDVFWEEPPDPVDDIFKYNLMATPHIGGATDISMQGIAASVKEDNK